MAKIIALFNHKGGVSKTTTTFNLGWILAEKGKSVVIVDTDPQCNLTGMVLDFGGTEDFAAFYEANPGRNMRDALEPAFAARPQRIAGVSCVSIPGRTGLSLLPGHIGLAEYEVTLGMAQELSASIMTLQNLPGAVNYLFVETAQRMGADYVIVDMNPSLSSMNKNILMISDYFIVPTSPDYFCSLAVNSLATILPGWKDWADRASQSEVLKSSTYPFPRKEPKFIGTIAQRYRPRGGAPASGFQRWIDRIAACVTQNLVPALRPKGMILSDVRYQQAAIDASTFSLASISDFNTLITLSQENRVPPFALTDAQIGTVGTVLEAQSASRDSFHAVFSNLADKILTLTGDS